MDILSSILMIFWVCVADVSSQTDASCVWTGKYLEMCSCSSIELDASRYSVSIRPPSTNPGRSCSLEINAKPGLALRVSKGLFMETQPTCSDICESSKKYLKIESGSGWSSYCNCGPNAEPAGDTLLATNESSVRVRYFDTDFAIHVTGHGCTDEGLFGNDKRISKEVVSGSPTTDSSYTVNMTCPDGFLMSAKYSWMENTCQKSPSQPIGTWSKSKTRCRRVVCEDPPDVANGGYSPRGETHRYTKSVEYYCDEGFELVGGPSTRYCMARHGEGPYWSDGLRSCAKISCGPIPAVANGRVIGIASTYGSVRVVECDSGYNIVGVNQIKCQANGTWSQAPVCQAVDCIDVPHVENGRVIHSSGIRNAAYGSVWRFTCAYGYRMLGNDTINCLPDGSWSQTPRCIVETCSTAPSLPNGVCTDCRVKSDYKVNATRTYRCNLGYKHQGNVNNVNKIMCEAGGVWTRPSPCVRIECPFPPTVLHGRWANISYWYNKTADVICDEGYLLDSVVKALCTGSGVWENIPKCVPVDCGKIPSDGITLPRKEDYATEYGSIAGVAMKCIDGYVFSSAVETVSCQENGQWSALPTCRKIECGNPHRNRSLNIANGTFEDFFTTNFGTVIKFSCSNGYMFAGVSSMTCQADASWSPVPRCIEIDCFEPHNITAAKLIAYNNTKVGAVAEYRCVSEVSTRRPVVATCGGDGVWAYPVCESDQKNIILWGFVATAVGIVLISFFLIVCVGLCFKRRADKRKTEGANSGASESSNGDIQLYINGSHVESDPDKPSIGSYELRRSKEDMWRRPEGSPPGPYSYPLAQPRSRQPIANENYSLDAPSPVPDYIDDVISNPLYAEIKTGRHGSSGTEPLSTGLSSPRERQNELNNQLRETLPRAMLPSYQSPLHERQANILDPNQHDGYQVPHSRSFSPANTHPQENGFSQTLPMRAYNSQQPQTLYM